MLAAILKRARHGLERLRWLLPCGLLVLVACSPTYDWRTVRSADGVVAALMPCKPQAHERFVALAGQPVKLSLRACEAGGQTWGLASADLVDPSRLAAALDELAAGAPSKVGSAARAAALEVPGATPLAGGQRLWLAGRRPDGQPVQMQVALFAHGTRVYQATVLGRELAPELADTYLQSLRVGP